MSQDSQANEPLGNGDSSRDSQDLMGNFYLERYKYILQEIRSLNANIYKYLTLFQTLAAAITTAGVAVFVGREQLNLSSDITRIAIQGLLGLLIILAGFVVFSIMAGIFSWLDYRSEEVDLIERVFGTDRSFRQRPDIKNFWRWQETHVILFIVLVVIAIIIYVQTQIIPLIK
ncbi:MAG: hypothetical protein QNJ41_13750 [Xenococcaceae cyanobacterium MO_188.B32]|nr:hypothetical protein [Xenococcaceae cyanobacterium MO_188.B32]